MTDDTSLYHSPAASNAPPAPIVAWLDGRNLEEKVGTAIGVYTADADGWPHPAQLSPGEVLLSPDGQVRLALLTELLTQSPGAERRVRLLTAVTSLYFPEADVED